MSAGPDAFELPEDLRPAHRKAVRLERLTIAYLISAVAVIYLTLGNSQAMRTAWIEDILSLLPPIAFLVATRIRRRPPSARFPWGYHRAISIAYLAASSALLLMGTLLFAEGAMKLATAEHPPIGTVVLFGEQLWLGWLMLPALAWSAVPAFFLGRAKLPLADALHDKVLYADAKMNKADWLTASAAAVGVIGIGLGLWWADALAAMLISADIAHDGWRNLRAALSDLMDQAASTYDGEQPHPVIARMEAALRECDWVREARVRVREEGHVFHAEAFVAPEGGEASAAQLDDARERLEALDWKLHDVVVAPAAQLPDWGSNPPAPNLAKLVSRLR
jgi:cation diffusion facilitator family transporter